MPLHPKKVCLVSLGCAKNLVDSEIILGFLKKDGFELSVDPASSDVIVINTCGFLEASRRESIDKILEMARYKDSGSCRALVVAGCLTQKHGEELAADLPEVDLFVGTSEFDKLSELLRSQFNPSPRHRGEGGRRPGEGGRVVVSRRQILPDPDLPRVQSTLAHTTYVKISEGCSHTCSFCTIPSIRGGLKSRTIDSIVREVEGGVARGIKEFNLIAQDLNEFGRDLKNGSTLAGLLEKLDKIPGNYWLRLLYMYPLEFNDRLIGVIRDAEHVVPYVDIPLQHISERVLLSMRRGSPGRYVRQLLTKLKTAIPIIALRTTFIVGYPGETEKEFQELCDFVQEYEFDRVGVFQFSHEDGTPSAGLSDPIADEIKSSRYDCLMKIQQKVSRKKNAGLKGKIFTALTEGASSDSSQTVARLASQAPEIDGVTLIRGACESGRFVSVRIVDTDDYDLFGEVTSDAPDSTSSRKPSVATDGERRPSRN